MLFPHAHSLTEVYAISGNYTPYCMYRLPASRSEAQPVSAGAGLFCASISLGCTASAGHQNNDWLCQDG